MNSTCTFKKDTCYKESLVDFDSDLVRPINLIGKTFSDTHKSHREDLRKHARTYQSHGEDLKQARTYQSHWEDLKKRKTESKILMHNR